MLAHAAEADGISSPEAEPWHSSKEQRSLTRSVLALTYSDVAKRLLEEKSFKELDKDQGLHSAL